MHTTVRIRKYEVVYYNNIYNHYASRRRVSFSRVWRFFNASYNYRHSSVTELSQLMVSRASLAKKKDRFIYIERHLNSYRLHIPIYIYTLLINSTAVSLNVEFTHVYWMSPVCVPVVFCFVLCVFTYFRCNVMSFFLSDDLFIFFSFFLLRVFACIFSGVEQQISTGFLLKLTSKINQQGGYNITR